MTDREILAELKASYEKLCDIIDNGSTLHCDGQMVAGLTKELESAKNNIGSVYYEFYKTLKRNVIMLDEDRQDDDSRDILISDDINYDYLDIPHNEDLNGDVFNHEDFADYYKWWEDTNFLNSPIEDED